MRYQTIVAAALSAVAVRAAEEKTGDLGDAAVVNDNPVGMTYVAELPEEAFTAIDVGGNIKGSISGTAGPDGKGVEFKVKFSNLPKEGGPFGYHLHSTPVPEDGNCTLTKAHLDPYIRGQEIPCDSEKPETCEVGDLSGKHGKITSDEDTFEATYIDLYASTKEGIGAFFGNRSIVIHYANSSRITCANFKLVDDQEGSGKPDDECENDGSHGGEDGEDDGGENDGEDGGDDTVTPPPPQGSAAPPAEGDDDASPVEAGAGLASTVSALAAFAALMFAL